MGRREGAIVSTTREGLRILAVVQGSARSHEVRSRAVVMGVEVIARAGLPTEPLFEGLAFDAHGLRRRQRVAWDDYAVIVERMEEIAGGGRALEELFARSLHATVPELRAAAGALLSPKALSVFILDVLHPLAFPAVDFRLEDLEPDRVRCTARLRPGAHPCAAWFRVNVGATRGIPRLLDLPEAVVTADVGADFGVYDVRLPPSRTLAARAERVALSAVTRVTGQLVLGVREDMPLSFDDTPATRPPEDADLAARVDSAGSAWDLTARQLRVLALLVRGDANKEIAQTLACAENTVELHVTQLLRKSGTPTRAKLIAKFWSEL
ncbi:Transcriptional regulator, LuxR family protein [Minicystis rosea]|nr:Transcriptional regulator, LuxR family protein [Minicystis rosea]